MESQYTADRKFALGTKVRDTITSVEGVIVAVTDWMYGCRRYTIQPTALHDGKPLEMLSFDEPQLEALPNQIPVAAARPTGGDRAVPSRGR